MKESVFTRNAFAAAHFAYAASLKDAGAALSDYAQGEVAAVSSTILPPPPYDSLRPPPTPPDFSTLQHAAGMPQLPVHESESQPGSIMERGNEGGEIEEHGLNHRSGTRSSGGGRGRIGISKKEMENETMPPPPSPPPHQSGSRTHPLPPDSMWLWDFFFPENVPVGPMLAEVDDDDNRRIKREEIWRKVLEEEKKSKIDGGGSGGGGYKAEDVVEPPMTRVVAGAAPAEVRRSSGKVNMSQIFSELDDCFLQASESAHEVSKILEANRLHYHSNFAENQGHVDHCARVMCVITWNKSFNGLRNPKDGKDYERNETHAIVLDKMLA